MTREVLPNRRYSESFDLVHLGIHYAGQVSFYEDGRVAEIFLGMEKIAGTAMDVIARDAAVLISLALQHGITLDQMLHSAIKDENGEPEGLIGYLLSFLQDYKPKADGWGSSTHTPTDEPKEPIGLSAREQARNMGFTGNQCSSCGSMQMKVSGHCEVCSECGTTTGCS